MESFRVSARVVVPGVWHDLPPFYSLFCVRSFISLRLLRSLSRPLFVYFGLLGSFLARPTARPNLNRIGDNQPSQHVQGQGHPGQEREARRRGLHDEEPRRRSGHHGRNGCARTQLISSRFGGVFYVNSQQYSHILHVYFQPLPLPSWVAELLQRVCIFPPSLHSSPSFLPVPLLSFRLASLR